MTKEVIFKKFENAIKQANAQECALAYSEIKQFVDQTGDDDLIFRIRILLNESITSGDVAAQQTQLLLQYAQPSSDDFFRAAANGQLQTLKLLLPFSAINARQWSYCADAQVKKYNQKHLLPSELSWIEEITPICAAASNGHTDVVRYLIKHGANYSADEFTSKIAPENNEWSRKLNEIKNPRTFALENQHKPCADLLFAYEFVNRAMYFSDGLYDVEYEKMTLPQLRLVPIELVQEAMENLLFNKLKDQEVNPKHLYHLLRYVHRFYTMPDYKIRLNAILCSLLVKQDDQRAILFAPNDALYTDKVLHMPELNAEENEALNAIKLAFMSARLEENYLSIDKDNIMQLHAALPSASAKHNFESYVRATIQGEINQQLRYAQVTAPLPPLSLKDRFVFKFNPPSQHTDDNIDVIRICQDQLNKLLGLFAAANPAATAKTDFVAAASTKQTTSAKDLKTADTVQYIEMNDLSSTSSHSSTSSTTQIPAAYTDFNLTTSSTTAQLIQHMPATPNAQNSANTEGLLAQLDQLSPPADDLRPLAPTTAIAICPPQVTTSVNPARASTTSSMRAT